MNNIGLVDDWKDKILGDLKNFSNKKYKPVGMHHLTADIKNYVGMKEQIRISYYSISIDEFKKQGFIGKLKSKLPYNEKDNLFKESVKSVIVYLISIPKFIFMQDINSIKKYFLSLEEQKKTIDNKLLYALSKYGYWGIAEGEFSKKIFSSIDKNKILENSNLGEITKDGFFITNEFGPRVFTSYMLTNAPLKQELDKPERISNEKYENAINNTNYLEYYNNTFGTINTIKDSIKSISSNNKFGKYISFCYNCKIGNEKEINLIVKDPLDYKD